MRSTGTSKVIFGYNGRDGVVTDDNGLIYMRARYYSPEMRRFVNADILAGKISNAVTLNRYAHANGNPVSNVDPFGLSAERVYNEERQMVFDEFKKIYFATYGKEYDQTQIKIEKSVETVEDYEPYVNNAIVGIISTSLSLILPSLGLSNSLAIVFSTAFGVIVGPQIMGAGDYPTYTITKTEVQPHSVPIANYHGYIVYEDRDFQCTQTETYYIVNGKIAQVKYSTEDEYLAYRYRNHS